MPEDIRKLQDRAGPQTGAGGGAAYGDGYGAGGLGAGGDRAAGQRPNSWDAPGVTPDGRRTGASTDGPRMAMDGESEPDPDPDPDPDDEA